VRISELVNHEGQEEIMVRDSKGIIIQYDHRDDDRRNNRPSNLDAIPQTENCKKAQKNKKRRGQEICHRANVYYVKYESSLGGTAPAFNRAILYGKKNLDKIVRSYSVTRMLDLDTRKSSVMTDGACHTYEIIPNGILPKEDEAFRTTVLKLASEYQSSSTDRQLKIFGDAPTSLEFTGSIDALYSCLCYLACRLRKKEFNGFTIDLVKFSKNLREKFEKDTKGRRQKMEKVYFMKDKVKECLFLIKRKEMDSNGENH
jgi:hypothetical protein